MIAKSYTIDHFPKKIIRLGLYRSVHGKEPLYDILEDGMVRLELMLEGRGWVRDGDGDQEVLPGDLLWHIHGDETISRNDFKNPYCCLAIQFVVPSGTTRIAPRFSRWESVEAARAFAKEVIAWYVDDSIDRQAILHFIYGALLIRANSFINGQSRPRLSSQARQIVDSLESNYKHPKTLQSIAKEVGCSLTHLHNTIREATGSTPHEIVTARRMRAAKELLASTHMQIKEIAIDCGFGTSAAFCNRFRALNGQSPLAYRKQQTSLNG